MFFVEKKSERRLEEIQKYIYRQKINIPMEYKEEDVYKSCALEMKWGGRDKVVWFKGQVAVPENYMGEKVAIFSSIAEYNFPEINPEALVYINGYALQGCDANHREIVIPERFLEAGILDIEIKAFSGYKERKNRFHGVELVTIDTDTEELFYAMKMARLTALTYEKDDYARESILAVIDRALNKLDWRAPGSCEFYASVSKALNLLKTELKELTLNTNRPVVNSVGHSHIDVAWLWQLKHTREKASRTFSTVLNLMEQYPEYNYFQSSPQLYQFIKEDYPEIYERIKERVKEGRWEVNGGMWVEPDCNVSSGEALVRQFLLGTRFFEKEFGVKNDILWIPDAFGFNGNLPQIAKKSGFKYFVTTKLGWSQFNRFPYDNFKWKGLDGSELLVNLMTMPEDPRYGESWAYSYNADTNPYVLKTMWKNYRHKDMNNKELLMVFGHGDGGGGTNREMIEELYTTEYVPTAAVCKMGTVSGYLERLEERLKDKLQLPTWNGELYLEVHRGTYTSQGLNKRYNRKTEILMHDVEALNYFAVKDEAYPQEKINKTWELILLNQFHDILPGSSIKEVYEDSIEQYRKITEDGKALKEAALKELISNISINGESVVVFNTLGWIRSGYIYIEKKEASCIFTDKGVKLSSQVVKHEGRECYMVYVKDIPSYGYKVLDIEKEENSIEGDALTITNNFLENKFFRVKLNGKGQITSIYDKLNDKEVLEEGKAANVITAYEDKPINFDAWDIDIFYKDKGYEVDKLISADIFESGTERGTLKLKWEYMNSEIEQQVHIYSELNRIDFETKVDWKESQTLLKAAFPVDIHSTKATYDIQFGNIERPTHFNTSWDYAKFEVPAHKWADLSQRDYGVSILNDSKYGYSIKENVMELTLIKSPIYPDETADRCEHNFVYSLYPHKGNFVEGDTVKAGYELNYPLTIAYGHKNNGTMAKEHCFVHSAISNVIIETIKRAEDSNSMVLRLYEYANGSSKGTVKFDRNIKAAYECSMLEEKIFPVSFNENTINLEFSPYELKCIMVDFE
ncbi:alpha-mannosidase [Clostridium swellfunianum]|uniref:alpha-mannosidase n=1 Tax=Clostridium swellfunianum TaxID=1367462 RepID=UPI00203069FD|nr:alpha-mannosidase [Clostridium swellfunianum]MCM0649674.1 alpha-mannosidase [Clostridium swellfunianum]